MDYKDYYETMGVARNASADDIKRAYRKLARKYHPDVSKEKGAEDKFKAMQAAWLEWNAQVPPVPEDARVDVAYTLRHMPSR